MLLTHLSLTNFRIFSRLDLDIPGGSVVLVGGNAQGKTSFLEAIYFLSTFVSFQAANERELINLIAGREVLAVARIVADFCLTIPPAERTAYPQQAHRLEVRLIQEANGFNSSPGLRKEVLLDGVKRKLSEVIGAFHAVLFLPQMLRIVEGAPEERRRYLNLAMGQVLPHYAAEWSEYSKVLAQRNALLKQLSERNGDLGQLNFWDEQLARLGGGIIHARIRAVQELGRLATRLHHELTRGGEVLRLSYQPSYDPLPQRPGQYALPLETLVDRSGIGVEKIQQGYLESLQQVRGEDIVRGVTTLGPHRDELRFLVNGLDLGIYGSRGQGRTVMLALKLAEVEWIKEKTGQWPVLLLDEVLAELDPIRREDLLSRLLASEQALLTTTDLNLFSADFLPKAKVWQMEAGRVVI